MPSERLTKFGPAALQRGGVVQGRGGATGGVRRGTETRNLVRRGEEAAVELSEDHAHGDQSSR